mgnify:CR=1 FL=1
MENRKGITSLVAFLIAILIIVLILVPLYFLIIGYSNPQYKGNLENNFPSYQVSSEEVTIYFASSYYKSSSTSYLNVSQPNPNYVLKAVYVIYNGTFVNVTSVVKPVPSSQPDVPAPPPSLPAKLIYNFTFPDVYSPIKNIEIPLWNSTLILQIEAYNQTTFLTALPNETAIAS